jgi:hypothetical protein
MLKFLFVYYYTSCTYRQKYNVQCTGTANYFYNYLPISNLVF